jgi:hypothetical protein
MIAGREDRTIVVKMNTGFVLRNRSKTVCVREYYTGCQRRKILNTSIIPYRINTVQVFNQAWARRAADGLEQDHTRLSSLLFRRRFGETCGPWLSFGETCG